MVNTYKRGDLLKMHTYNDAIRRTIGSYVLYPGSYNINSKRNETFSLYDEILPGVGAFSIKPSIGVLGENELKSFIVSLIECKKANNSRLNRLKYYTEMILSEPSMFKEQGVKYNSESKSDMYVIGYIRAASQKDYYYFLKKNGFLHTGSEFFFYFYAIKGKDVYSHHKDIFRATHFRFYINQIHKSNTYMLEVSQLYNKLYYIYRIFNLRENNLDVKYYRINGAIDENFKLNCTEYLALKK